MALLFYTSSFSLPPGWSKDGVIIEYEMKRIPLLSVLKDAKHTIQIAAYSLTDAELIDALGDAIKRNVTIEVLVTNNVFKRESYLNAEELETPIQKLKKLGANIKPSPEFYQQAHGKLIIIDESYALIGTGNMNKDAFDGNANDMLARDFWITVTDKKYVKELIEVFKADFRGEKTNLKNSLLVWGPDQGREPFINLIHSAKKDLWIYQQSLEDKEITETLVKAAGRGVNVRLLMTPYPFTKKVDENLPNQEMIRQAGGKVGLMTHLYAHAKVIMVDVSMPSARIWIGSTNFYPPSLESNRELGIITSDPAVINKIRSIFESDWKQADFTPRKY